VDVQKGLERQGFQVWRIKQAACNLTLKHRNPELYSNEAGKKDSGPSAIITHLLHHEETISDVALAPPEINAKVLRAQMTADGLALLQHLDPATPGNLSQKAIQGRLQRMGLLKL